MQERSQPQRFLSFLDQAQHAILGIGPDSNRTRSAKRTPSFINLRYTNRESTRGRDHESLADRAFVKPSLVRPVDLELFNQASPNKIISLRELPTSAAGGSSLRWCSTRSSVNCSSRRAGAGRGLNGRPIHVNPLRRSTGALSSNHVLQSWENAHWATSIVEIFAFYLCRTSRTSWSRRFCRWTSSRSSASQRRFVGGGSEVSSIF